MLRHTSFRSFLSKEIPKSEKFIARAQKGRTTGSTFFWRSATELGNESGTIVLLTAVGWLMDADFGRYLVILWVSGFALGNYMKEWFSLPRPSSPPVEKLEHSYANEYGFPSSHAFNAWMTSLYIALRTHSLFALAGATLLWALVAACVYSGLITYSRLFLGVHSHVDLLGGTVLGGLTAWLWLYVDSVVDQFLTQAPLVGTLIFALVAYLYPNQSLSNPAYLDVLTICGVAAGVVLARGYSPTVITPLLNWQEGAARMVVGITAVLAVKLLANLLLKPLGEQVRKFGGNAAVSFTAAALVPLAFPWALAQFGIHQQ